MALTAFHFKRVKSSLEVEGTVIKYTIKKEALELKMYFHLQLGPFGIYTPEPEERVTNRLRLLDWMVVRDTTQITI